MFCWDSLSHESSGAMGLFISPASAPEVAKLPYLFMNFNLDKNIRSISQTISAVITGHTF